MCYRVNNVDLCIVDFSQDVSNKEFGAESSVENETNEYKREEQTQEVGR